MQCGSCGTQLPEGAAYCPTCATPTSQGISQSQATPYDPTAVSSSSYPPPPPPASTTDYGSPPYGGSPLNPYEVPNPYAEPQQPYASSSPANSRRRPNKTLLVIIIAVVLIIVGGGVGVSLMGLSLVHGTNQVTATPTPVPSPATHYPFSTDLVVNDSLSNNSHAVMYGWGVAANANGGCVFLNDAYEVTTHQNYIYCPAHNTDFSNFTYEIQMTIKTGGPGAMGGVIFRHELGTGKNYMFFLGVDGSYELDVNMSYTSGKTLKSGTISGFTTGFNQLHTIGIVANGPQISVYVDQKQITQVADSTYASGKIGMLSRYGTSSTTVDYTNVKVWQL